MTDTAFDLDQLSARAEDLVRAARKAGADEADTVVSASRSVSVQVRDGAVEDTKSSESAGFQLRVFVGRRTASVSTNDAGDPGELAARAVAMAKVSPEDAFAGLAPEDRLARAWPDLDLHDATSPTLETMTEQALACEAAALAVKGVAKSSGAGYGAREGASVLATSHGFSGAYRGTGRSLSVSVIAGEGERMERDYAFDSQRHAADLRSAADIGAEAGRRAAERVGPTTMPTGTYPIVLSPRIARGFVGHITGAANGALIARGTSYLKDGLGKQVAASGMTITDNPLKMRGSASQPFDDEGVAGEAHELMENGVLLRWVLDSATGRELGLPTNGRAGRSGSGTSPSSTNLTLHAGSRSPEAIIAAIPDGLYVTELIGQGANLVTGRYSRGASGFRIRNGTLSHAVSEVTIAGDLAEMLMRLEPADDLEHRYSTNAPTLLIDGMTLAGR